MAGYQKEIKMAETNTLKVTYNKTQYNKGETMTVTLSGNVVVTSDITLTNLQANVSLSDGSKVNVVLPSTVIKDGQVSTLTGKLTSITDASGRVWTVASDGLTATAVA